MRSSHISLVFQTPSSKSLRCNTVATSAARHDACESKTAPRNCIARDRACRCASYDSRSNSSVLCAWPCFSKTCCALDLRRASISHCIWSTSATAASDSRTLACRRSSNKRAVSIAIVAAAFISADAAFLSASAAALATLLPSFSAFNARFDSDAITAAWRSASARADNCWRSSPDTTRFFASSFEFSSLRRLSACDNGARKHQHKPAA